MYSKGISSAIGVLPPPVVGRFYITLAASCFISVPWMTSNLNSDKFDRSPAS